MCERGVNATSKLAALIADIRAAFIVECGDNGLHYALLALTLRARAHKCGVEVMTRTILLITGLYLTIVAVAMIGDDGCIGSDGRPLCPYDNAQQLHQAPSLTAW